MTNSRAVKTVKAAPAQGTTPSFNMTAVAKATKTTAIAKPARGREYSVAEYFSHDTELNSLIHEIKCLQTVSAEHKDKLIRRAISYAYELKSSDFLCGIAPYFRQQKLTDVAKATVYTLEEKLKKYVHPKYIQSLKVTVYEPSWREHDAICRELAAIKPYTGYKDHLAAEKAAKAESRPTELIKAYSKSATDETITENLLSALSRLAKQNQKDANYMASYVYKSEEERRTTEKGLEKESQIINLLTDVISLAGADLDNMLNRMKGIN